mmetsp:Transcript_260/g.556  ORF Transcript_260/g.556 Transcript_260/m.556 type:complete len:182 (+) Transcript_260:78-623(+)|eukprot:CAMPEP_0177635060 /NCGR_PEP_ID=MMETSP0447-20121125/3698_1 /TAXON_ID=0 /ORGANISM="Stygamoeba regulata, Strain BSH-02190019" /LENGTH=181 /DNA_ID=CAMNT_0019136819 /DNA_START=61 /DNA_END=606 /DNA_ORIENTATION=+
MAQVSVSASGSLTVRPLWGDRELDAAVGLLSVGLWSDVYGITREKMRAALTAPDTSVFSALCCQGELRGVLVLDLVGSFKGYIRMLAVAQEWQGKGVGSALVKFAEELIFSHYSPNVFICYTPQNPRAGDLYRRLGYTEVGVLRDYVKEGVDEVLLRKTIGPKLAFQKKAAAPATPTPHAC